MSEDNQAVLSWLKDEGAIHIDDNVIVAEKAFFANSVVRWYKRQINDGTMKGPQIENCIFVLRKFLKGKLDLCWDNGIIKVKKSSKGEIHGSNSLESADG
jgi:hypothetical protein